MADCTCVLVGNIKIISVINLGLVKRFLAVYFLFRLGELRWEHGFKFVERLLKSTFHIFFPSLILELSLFCPKCQT